ncbi:response regulator, partial [Clostridium perfringens]|nr:response regulator [Clostridium perfringens]
TTGTNRAMPHAIEVDESGPLPVPPTGPRLDGSRVLVVDDERDALTLVGEVLREHGAEVHLASSAAEALDKLPAVRPHVVVSDIGMPENDGLT